MLLKWNLKDLQEENNFVHFKKKIGVQYFEKFKTNRKLKEKKTKGI